MRAGRACPRAQACVGVGAQAGACLTCATPQMLSFMHAQYSFFQQGYSLLHQLDPYMKKLAAEVSGGQGGAGSWVQRVPLPPRCSHSWTSW